MVESEKKFADSYKAAQHSMHNVMQNEQEYVMQIHALSTSLNVGITRAVRTKCNFVIDLSRRTKKKAFPVFLSDLLCTII